MANILGFGYINKMKQKIVPYEDRLGEDGGAVNAVRSSQVEEGNKEINSFHYDEGLMNALEGKTFKNILDVLKLLGMEDKAQAFKANGINLDSLYLLEEVHLREMGLNIGDRLKLLRVINLLRSRCIRTGQNYSNRVNKIVEDNFQNRTVPVVEAVPFNNWEDQKKGKMDSNVIEVTIDLSEDEKKISSEKSDSHGENPENAYSPVHRESKNASEMKEEIENKGKNFIHDACTFTHYIELNPAKASCTLLNGKPKRVDGPFAQIFGRWSDVEPLWKYLNKHKINEDVLFAFHSLPANYVRRAAVPSKSDRCGNGLGYLYSRDYDVIRIEKVKENRLVCLRDPGGQSHWQGKWSQFDRRNWTSGMQKRLNYKLPSKEHDITTIHFCSLCKLCCCFTGCKEVYISEREVQLKTSDFWISLEDAVSCSRSLKVTRKVDGWDHIRIEGAWRGLSAGGPPFEENFVYNPQFDLEFQWYPLNKMKCALVLISITTAPGTVVKGNVSEKEKLVDWAGVNMLLLSLNNKPLSSEINASTVVGTSGDFSTSMPVTLEADIPRIEDQVYKLIASRAQAAVEGSFVLDIYSNIPFNCTIPNTERRIRSNKALKRMRK